MLLQIPPELHITVLTYLRATDLSSLQQTCKTFSNRKLIKDTITTFATKIYPPSLTTGYDTPAISGEVQSVFEERPTFEILRNMEMLLVARVLSRPEPLSSERRMDKNCFYVSKAWCKAALKWLEVQEEQKKERYKLKLAAVQQEQEEREKAQQMEDNLNGHGGKKKKNQKHAGRHGKGKKQMKKMKKQERKKNRKFSDTLPPWQNLNHDIVCEHGGLKTSCSHHNSNTGGTGTTGGESRSARAKRRLMDKQAWKVLKKLYPEGIQLSALHGECIQCAMETETKKRNEEMKKHKQNEERRKPLENVHVRKFYTRTRGVPKDCLTMPEGGEYENHIHNCNHASTKISSFGNTCTNLCPLKPGVYYVLPRAWCHKWRKYIKTGEGSRPHAPDTSACLCDAHRLPLIPPHLESFLYGESSSLLGTSSDIVTMNDNALGGHDNGEIADQAAANSFSSPTSAPAPNVVTIHDLVTPSRNTSASASASITPPRPLPVGFYPVDQRLGRRPTHHSNRNRNVSSSSIHASPQVQPYDDEIISTLRASGLSESEIQLQRLAMIQIEEEREREQRRAEEEAQRLREQQLLGMQQASQSHSERSIVNMLSPEDIRANLNAKLDHENIVVVEILTDEEFIALEQWWPEIHSSYALKFAVVENDNTAKDIVWTTYPCQACDASGYHSNHDFVVRNRCRNWVNASQKKKKK